jgi:hypothetical protein
VMLRYLFRKRPALALSIVPPRFYYCVKWRHFYCLLPLCVFSKNTQRLVCILTIHTYTHTTHHTQRAHTHCTHTHNVLGIFISRCTYICLCLYMCVCVCVRACVRVYILVIYLKNAQEAIVIIPVCTAARRHTRVPEDLEEIPFELLFEPAYKAYVYRRYRYMYVRFSLRNSSLALHDTYASSVFCSWHRRIKAPCLYRHMHI